MSDENSKQEQEKKERESRILFGSLPEQKTIRLDTNISKFTIEELAEHKDSFLKDTAPKKQSELPYLLKHIFIGLIIMMVGAVTLFFVWPAYARSNATIPGATLIFFFGGIAGLIGGFIYILYRVYDFFLGMKLSTPENSVKTFVKSIEDKNWRRIWNCITPKGKESFNALMDYRAYLEQTIQEIQIKTKNTLGVGWKVHKSISDSFQVTPSYEIKFDNIQTSILSEDMCECNFDLIVEQSRSIDKKTSTADKFWGSFIDGELVLKQYKCLVRFNDEWFLTSGRINTP